MPGVKGYNCVLTAGEETIAYAKDVELSLDSDEIDVTTRNSGDWKEFLQGHKEWTLDIEQLWVGADDGIQALIDSWLQGTTLSVAIKDENGLGWDGTAFVQSLRLAQPLTDAVGLPCTLRGTGELSQDTES